MIHHELVRALNIPVVVEILSKYYGISEEEALDRFYTSGTAAALADEETGLYGESPLQIAIETIVERDGEANFDEKRL